MYSDLMEVVTNYTVALVLALLASSCQPYGRVYDPERRATVAKIDILDTVGNAVSASVQILALDKDGGGISRGSGVVIGRNTVLTARHMTEGNGVAAWLVKQGTQLSEAYCVRKGSGPQDDWAVLALASPVGHPVRLVASGGLSIRLHAQAVAIGYALGMPTPSVTVGHIQEPYGKLIRMTSPIVFGNSGGGLFVLEDGELRLAGLTVAVFTSGMTPICHLGLSVSVEDIRSQGGLSR